MIKALHSWIIIPMEMDLIDANSSRYPLISTEIVIYGTMGHYEFLDFFRLEIYVLAFAILSETFF